MESSHSPQVAIIGAGLAGLGLAIALHSHSVPCALYEARSPGKVNSGAIMLAPNSLRILDAWGVYERIRVKGYSFEDVTFMDDKLQVDDAWSMGHERYYGYKALRIYRQVFVDELLAVCQERGIEIHYGKKFSRVVSEADNRVSFELADGSIETASLLIGADGIHSQVRNYIAPGSKPVYIGLVAMCCAVQTSKLRLPPATAEKNFPLPVSISTPNGTFVLAPQDVDGSEVLAGMQAPFAPRDRAGWDAFAADTDELLRLMQRNMHDWPDVVQSALQNTTPGTFYIWPFHNVPRLDSWASPHNGANPRVILIGDAAHAIPPTAGQGANQAFEDAFTLTLLLKHSLPSTSTSTTTTTATKRVSLSSALAFWQPWRQRRVDQVLELTMQMNNRRLPPEEQAKLPREKVWHGPEVNQRVEGDPDGLAWLYRPRQEEEVREWIEKF